MNSDLETRERITWLERALARGAAEAAGETDWESMAVRVQEMMARERRDLLLGYAAGLCGVALTTWVFSLPRAQAAAAGLSALAVVGVLMTLRGRRRVREIRRLERVQADLTGFLRRDLQARLREARFMIPAWLACALLWLGSLFWFAADMPLRQIVFCTGFGLFLVLHALYTAMVVLPRLRREMEALE